MPRPSFEQRLTVVEAELERMRKTLSKGDGSNVPWWEKIAGTFAGDAAYLEAMRLGKQFRRSTRPKSLTRRKSRHGRT